MSPEENEANTDETRLGDMSPEAEIDLVQYEGAGGGGEYVESSRAE